RRTEAARTVQHGTTGATVKPARGRKAGGRKAGQWAESGTGTILGQESGGQESGGRAGEGGGGEREGGGGKGGGRKGGGRKGGSGKREGQESGVRKAGQV